MFEALRERIQPNDRSADDYMTFAGHVSDNMGLLEDGTHFAVIKVEGKPLALMDDGERYGERRRRHAVYRALADSNIVVYEHLVAHDGATAFRPAGFRSGYPALLSREYHAAIETGLLKRDWYITIMAKPPAAASFFAGMWRTEPRHDAELARQVDDRCRVVLDSLPDYKPRRLGVAYRHGGVSGSFAPPPGWRADGIAFSEIGEALRCVLYGRWGPVPVTATRLADAIYCQDIICGLRGFEIRGAGGSSFGAMIGLLDYIEQCPPRMLDALLAMPTRLVMTNSYAFLSRGKVTETLALVQTQMQNAKDRAVSLSQGLDDAIDDVASGRGLMGDHHVSWAVHVDRYAELPGALSKINSLLVNCGLPVTDERMGCEPAVYAQLPGSPKWLRCRHGPISAYNMASFSSLLGEPVGGGTEKWGKPLLRLRTATGGYHDLHLHVNGVGHFGAIGPTGYGKTTVLGLLGVHVEPAIAPYGGAVVFLDADGSNELTIRASGGYYARIRRGIDSGMAPIKALEDTQDAHAWLLEFVLGLITSDGGRKPPQHQVERIAFGIRFILGLPPALRSFAALRQFMDWDEEGAGARFSKWCKGGSHGWAFDGDQDVIRFDPGVTMFGIDNTEILEGDMPDVCEAMAAYQFFRIGAKVGTGIPSAVLVDEMQAYLPNERYARGFEKFITRLRKGNGVFGYAIQQPDKILNHPIGKALAKNTPTFFLFPSKNADHDDYRHGLGCTEGEWMAVRESALAMGKGTFLVKRNLGSFLARADLSALPQHIAVLSADPNRRELCYRLMREFGDRPEQWVPHYLRRYNEAGLVETVQYEDATALSMYQPGASVEAQAAQSPSRTAAAAAPSDVEDDEAARQIGEAFAADGDDSGAGDGDGGGE